MTKDELVTKQQLQIEELKEQNEYFKQCLRNIHNVIYGIGGPLNDNKYRYTNYQLGPFAYIANQIDEYEIIDEEE